MTACHLSQRTAKGAEFQNLVGLFWALSTECFSAENWNIPVTTAGALTQSPKRARFIFRIVGGTQMSLAVPDHFRVD